MATRFGVCGVSGGGRSGGARKGKAEEKRACVACHGLRIVHVQRLTRAQWDRELTKMAGWGSPIKDREALLEYLVANFGDDKPVAPLPRSEDASNQKR